MAQFASEDGGLKKLTRKDLNWVWAARAYGKRINGSAIEWDNHEVANSLEYPSEHVIPSKETKGCIRISETVLDGQQIRKATFDEMWSCCIFELINMTNGDKFLQIHENTIKGNVTKKEWVRLNTELEYSALVKLKVFFGEVWVPWSQKNNHRYEALCWMRNTAANYAEWIGQYQHSAMYKYWEDYYDNRIVPYLKKVVESNNIAQAEPPAPSASARQRIIYASSTGAKLDSDVRTGGGHDDTALLQAALDQATSGPLELIMDGAALISGLTIHSHTTVRCVSSSCGFFLKKQSSRPLLINAHRTADPEAIIDQDIRLLGGTYNGNGLPDDQGAVDGNQLKSTREYSFTVALGFYGIADFTATGITILHPRNYALHLANWRHVVLENDRVDVGVSEGINYDGIHFNGPGQDASVHNLSVHSWDDALAFNADDQAVANDPAGPT